MWKPNKHHFESNTQKGIVKKCDSPPEEVDLLTTFEDRETAEIESYCDTVSPLILQKKAS